jgi:uncharacterized protein YgiM (DUF1202 family)
MLRGIPTFVLIFSLAFSVTVAAQPAETGASTTTKATRRHRTVLHSTRSDTANADVEAATGHLLLAKDAWAYSRPTKLSPTVERVHTGKYVNVTGTTRDYVQVRLKSGQTAYVPQSAVQLVAPTEKDFTLTADSPVYSAPSRSSKAIAEVHRGHNVHVIGLALNYLKIKMKDGLAGYVPQTAAE